MSQGQEEAEEVLHGGRGAQGRRWLRRKLPITIIIMIRRRMRTMRGKEKTKWKGTKKEETKKEMVVKLIITRGAP